MRKRHGWKNLGIFSTVKHGIVTCLLQKATVAFFFIRQINCPFFNRLRKKEVNQFKK